MSGWASNNKFSLLGAMRSSAQMISYEVTLGLSVVGVLMIYGTYNGVSSFELNHLIRAQGETLNVFGLFSLPKWGIIVQPLGFILFLIASYAETNRLPFDMPEDEAALVAGYHTEYGGMKFAVFFMSEYVSMVTASCLVVILFFGGWQVPYLQPDGFHLPGGFSLALPHLLVVLLQVAAFAFKVVFFCWFLLLIRWTLPRFRYDQLMRLGWKFLLPVSILNIFITALVLLLI